MKQKIKLILIVSSFMGCMRLNAQQSKLDALFIGADTTAVIDSLLIGFDEYLDSIMRPKNFINVSVGIGTGLFNDQNSSSYNYTSRKSFIVSPEVGYFHRSGLALSLTGYLLKNGSSFKPGQYIITPSYQLLDSRSIAAGISYSRYFTSKNVSQISVPFSHELYSYFYIKKWWIEPGISASYGWGTTTLREQDEIVITKKNNYALRSIIDIQTNRFVKDLFLLFSLRHKFRFEKLLAREDLLTITPALLLTGSTQNIGSSIVFSSRSKFITTSMLPGNANISEKQRMHFQSTALAMQLNYATTHYYLMPQVLIGYYLYDIPQRINSVYSITIGHTF